MANRALWSKGPFITEYSKLPTESSQRDMVKAQLATNNGRIWIQLSSCLGARKFKTDLDYAADNIHLLKKKTEIRNTLPRLTFGYWVR